MTGSYGAGQNKVVVYLVLMGSLVSGDLTPPTDSRSPGGRRWEGIVGNVKTLTWKTELVLGKEEKGSANTCWVPTLSSSSFLMLIFLEVSD